MVSQAYTSMGIMSDWTVAEAHTGSGVTHGGATYIWAVYTMLEQKVVPLGVFS